MGLFGPDKMEPLEDIKKAGFPRLITYKYLFTTASTRERILSSPACEEDS